MSENNDFISYHTKKRYTSAVGSIYVGVHESTRELEGKSEESD